MFTGPDRLISVVPAEVFAPTAVFQQKSLEFTASARWFQYSTGCRVALEASFSTTGPALGRQRAAPERHWSAKVVTRSPD